MKRLLLSFFTLITFLSIAQYDKYEDKYAAINEKGEIVFTFWAKTAYEFENGRAEIKKYVIKGNKAYYLRGFLDSKGNLAVPCEYERVKDFKDEVTWVRKRGEDRWRLIDKNGNQVTSKTFENVGYFFDGMSSFKENNLKGFVNTKGEVVIPPKYVGGSFSEGLVCLTKADGANSTKEVYGFLNTKGEVVIPFQYNQAGNTSFKNGLARVKINGKTGLIDKEGNIVVQPKYSTMNCVSADYKVMAVSSGGYTNFKFVTFDYKPLFEGTFDGVKSFKNERAVVSKSLEVNGVVDLKGNFIIPFGEYSIINDLDSDGYIVVMEDLKDAKGNKYDTKMSYYDKDGKPFTDVPYRSIGSLGEGNLLPYYHKDLKLWGYLNKDGEEVIKPLFEKAKPYGSNGLAIVKLKEGVNVPKASGTNNYSSNNSSNNISSNSSNNSTTSTNNTSSNNNSNNSHDVQSTDSKASYQKGDVVLAQWSDGWWYPAKIAASGKYYSIAYFDGYTSKNPASKVRPFTWKRGDTIYANWQAEGKYWEATINDISGEYINITYTSDRSTDKIHFKLCRSK